MAPEVLLPLLAVAALVAAVAWVGSRVGAKWYGPFPGETELRSSYYKRKAVFAVWCFVALALAGLAVWTLTSVVPAVRDSQVAIVMFSVLAFLGGMAALGAVVAGLASIKAAVFGPNPVLRVQWEQARLKGESCDSEA